MSNTIKKILSDLNETWQKKQKKNIKWAVSKDDEIYFKEAAEHLNSLGVSNVLDIACGAGHFIKHCMDNKIEGYGIEPRHEGQDAMINIGSWHTDLRKQGKIVYFL